MTARLGEPVKSQGGSWRKRRRAEEQRRRFLKLLVTVGGVSAIASVAPWTEFLLSTIIRPPAVTQGSQRIRLPDARIATIDNVSPDTSATFVYPRSGDPIADAEPLRMFQLIRLPKERGGGVDDASAFRAYSNVCVHLWCPWSYARRPNGKSALLCPCHGSKYRPADGLAVAGPASLQTPPNNVLPRLCLEVDDAGTVWVLPPVWTVNRNGVIGFGRYIGGGTRSGEDCERSTDPVSSAGRSRWRR